MRKAARQRASEKIDVSLAITHLSNAIVELRMVEHADANTPTRQLLANARAQVGAVVGTIALLEGKAFHEPH